MKKSLSLIVVILAVVAFSCSRGEKETALSIPFEKYTLPNGLTVILHEDKSDPIASVAIYYHVGSSRETEGKTGFAHLFEHMMFQRSENVGEDEFFRNIQGAGGSLNGSTSQDRTNYYQVVPKNALEMVLWMESDRMGYLENTVTQAAFVNQQNVVMNEKRQSYDNAPYGFTSEVILKNLYPKGHPYSWTVIGEMEDLANATIDDVKAFHRKFYSPSNAYMAITGDIDKVEVKALVEKYFGEIPAGEPIEKRGPMPVSLASTKKLYIAIGAPSIPRTHPDYYPAYVTNYKLGGSFNGLFNLILREEKGYTYGARSNFSGSKNYGAFTASSSVGTNATLESVDIFKTEMEKYRESMPQEFIDFTKSALIKSNALRFETIGSLLGMLNTMTAYDLPYDYIKQEEAFVRSLTAEKQLELARKYIDPSRMYYVVAGDAATQLKSLEKIGLGRPVLVTN